MKHRLYHPPPIAAGALLTLERDRAHYLTHVLRLRRGTHLEVFDGAGRAWRATLTGADRRSATLAIGELIAEVPLPEPELHLVQGLLKGTAMDTVVQKATELGATDIWPVLAERSNVPGDAERLTRKHEHWQRVIESAAEQCGALHLTRLHEVRTPAEFWDSAPQARHLFLQPGARELPLDIPRESLVLMIGPEGGWSESELATALVHDVCCVGLGQRVLRAETAPLAVLGAVRHSWGWT
jgi:16S rRNA (uracil1498-N3)-methyltransferase